MMEEWGSGYQRINDACHGGGYPEPEWIELGSAVRVVFRPHPDVERMSADDTVNATNVPVNVPVNVTVNVPVNVTVNERQKWFLEQISAGNNPKASDVSTHYAVTTMTAKRDIADLKERGVVEFVGSAKTGSYKMK